MAKRCKVPSGIFKGKQVSEVNFDGKGRQKPMSFDIQLINNETIYDLFLGKVNTAAAKINKLMPNPEMYKKFKKNLDNSDSNNVVMQDLNSETVTDADLKSQIGNIIKYRSLALSEIFSAFESEKNIEENIGLTDPGMIDTLKNNDGSRKVNALNIEQTVGQQLATHMGFKISADPNVAKATYQQIGRVAIESLSEAGLVNIVENDSILNPGFYNDNLKSYDRKGAKVIDGFRTVSVNLEAFLTDRQKKLPKEEQLKITERMAKAIESGDMEAIGNFEKLESTMNGISAVGRLVKPSNMLSPLNDTDYSIESPKATTKDLGTQKGKSGITARHQKLLNTIQSKNQKLNPIITKLLKHMHDTMNSLNDIDIVSPEATLKNLYKAIGVKGGDLQNAIFGSFNGSNTDDFKSKIGQSISKENPLLQLIMMAPEFMDENGDSTTFHHQLNAYRTTRIEYLSTFLNEQMDKNFSRPMVQGDPVTMDPSSAIGKLMINEMIHSINDESGLNVKQITEEGFDPAIDYLLKRFEANFIDPKGTPQGQLKFLEALTKGEIGPNKLKFKMKGGVFSNLDALNAIYDIRQGNGGSVTSAYRTKLDAAASGVMLSFMQNMGKEGNTSAEDKVYEVMRKLGYTKDMIGSDPELKDAYHILLQQLKDSMNDKDTPDTKTFPLMEELSDLGLFKDPREIAKPMTMVTNYQAGEETAVDSTAAELRDVIKDYLEGGYESNPKRAEALAKIKEMVEFGNPEMYKDLNVDKMSEEQIANIPGVNSAIDQYFKKNLAEQMRDQIDNAIDPIMKKYKGRVNAMFAAMEKVFMEDQADTEKAPEDKVKLMIIPAMAWMTMSPDEKAYPGKPGSDEFIAHHNELIKKYGMPLTSRRQAISETNDGTKVLSLKEVPNKLTASVNAIHGTDAAIFFLSHESTLIDLKNILDSGMYDGQKLSKEELAGFQTAFDDASGMIHDANNANPYYNLIYKKHYRNNSVEISSQYDVEEQLSLSYMSMKDANRQHSEENAMTYYERSAENKKKKQEALGDIDENSFRFFGFPDTALEMPAQQETVGSETTAETEATPEPTTADTTEVTVEPFDNPFLEDGRENKTTYTPQEEIDNILETSTNPAVVLLRKLPNWKKLIESGFKFKFDNKNKKVVTSQLVPKGFTAQEAIEHEVTHFMTHEYLSTPEAKKTPAYKFMKSTLGRIEPHVKDIVTRLRAEGKDHAANRLEYIFNQPTLEKQMSEFTAIVSGETAVTKDIAKAFNDTKNAKIPTNGAIKTAVKSIMNATIKFFTGNDINVDELFQNVNSIIQAGSEANLQTDTAGNANLTEAEAKAEMKKSLQYNQNAVHEEKESPGGIPIIEPGWRIANEWSGKWANQIITNMAEPTVETGFEIADDYLSNTFPVYKKNRDYITDIWNSNNTLQSMKGYLNRARVGDLDALNSLEAIQLKAEQDVRKFEDDTIANTKRLLREARKDGKPLTDQDISDIHKAVSYTPMFHLINELGDLNRILKAKDPAKEIEKMIRELRSGLNAKRANDAMDLGMFLAKKAEMTTSRYYNVEQMNITDNTKPDVQRLVALYTLQNVDGRDNAISILNQNQDLQDDLVVTSSALKELYDSMYDNSKDKKSFRENLVYEQFESPKEFRAVNVDDIASGKYPAAKGWKILRDPKSSSYGVVWRNRDKVTVQSGAGLDTDYKYYDIMVDKRIQMKGAKGAMKVTNGTNDSYHKIVLTQKELDSFDDLITNPAESMARSYGQFLMVKQTQAARDYIKNGDKIKSFTTIAQGEEYNRALKDMKPEDQVWFIKVPSSTSTEAFLQNNPEIANLYKVPDQVSSINGFNQEFHLVRKDLNDMILGYKDPELFEDNKTLRNVAYAIRQGVVLVKTHWVIVNPKKIGADIISNNIILAAYGVPIGQMMKGQKDGLKYGKEMGDMRSELVGLEFEILSMGKLNKNKTKKKALERKRDALIKKIENHPMAPLVQNGMIQSMSTDILRKDESVVAGLQKDVEKIFNLVLKDEKGDPTGVVDAIKAFNELGGFGVDDLLNFAGESLENTEILGQFGKDFGAAFKNSGGRLKDKKESGDMARYLSEFIASPDSEAVRLGSYLVQQADISARYTLYSHLKNTPYKNDPKTGERKKLSEEEITTIVLEAFVDYKVNMPKELKAMSDYGILLFPSFWMRIHKIAYAIAKDNPLKVASGLALEEAMGINISTYADSTILFRDSIFSEPPVFSDTLDIFFPTDLIKLLTPL